MMLVRRISYILLHMSLKGRRKGLDSNIIKEQAMKGDCIIYAGVGVRIPNTLLLYI